MRKRPRVNGGFFAALGINLIFDLCVPVEVKDSERKEILNKLNNKLKERDKRFNTVIRIDNIV